MALDPNDDNESSNELPDEKEDFLEEMRDLFDTDPDEVVDRLEDAGYTVDDLEL